MRLLLPSMLQSDIQPSSHYLVAFTHGPLGMMEKGGGTRLVFSARPDSVVQTDWQGFYLAWSQRCNLDAPANSHTQN